MQNCLHDQIGRNVHAYVDDIVVKLRNEETLIDDLKETFDNLRVYKMMLNPAKCVFGVPAGKLLGFLVSNRGIEATLLHRPFLFKGKPTQCSRRSKKDFWRRCRGGLR